jgi:dTDP-4-amino-4,6-dideoxygalactose transaminase
MPVAQEVSRLAIHGGPKAVTTSGEDRWPVVPVDAAKRRIGALLEQGVLSIADGSGIVGEFEEAFRARVGTRYALAMTNGTATLHSAYFAAGAGPGTEVIVPSYTWHASITPILHCAATPVFCEIDPVTLTIDPADFERKITPRTRAVCAVHTWGNVADMDSIVSIARKHGIVVIEDASHAHGASLHGMEVGGLGDIGCFSMQGQKAVSGGEAGVATTNDPELFDRMVLLAHFGRITKGQGNRTFDHLGDMSLGAKYRPHPFAIALACCNLERLDQLNGFRTRNYEFLNARLRGVPGMEIVDPRPGSTRGGYLEFKFKISKEIAARVDTAKIEEALKAEGAPVSKDRYSSFNYTYGLLHTAPLFTSFDRTTLGGCFYDFKSESPLVHEAVSLPVTEDVCNRLISTYAFVDVEEEYLAQIADAFRKVMENVDQIAT